MVVDVQGKSDLTPLFSRDAATVRDLERAVVSLRQQVSQVQAPRGGVAPPALAGVGRAQDQLAAAQRQAVQVAARAALPPGLPRAGAGASLVPRPEMGAGVFGAGGGTAAAAMARQQASSLARQNEWQRGQDRLAALAGAGRGPTSQGPQAAREMADAAERLNRTLRDSAGLTRQATDAERDRGKAVGSSAAAVAAGASAALGAGVAAAGAARAGVPAAPAAGRRVRAIGEEAAGGVRGGRSLLDRVLADGGPGALLAQSKAARAEFQELAGRAGKVADSAETALEAADVLKSTARAAAPTRREVIAGARVESARDLSAALADRTRAAFLQAQGATPASLAGQFQKEFDRSQRAAVVARGEAAGFNAEAQRRRAGVIEGEDFRYATGQGLLSQNLDASNAARARRIAAEDRRGLLDHPEFVTRRQQEAAAGLAGRQADAGERLRAAAVLGQLQGGGAYHGAAVLDARAGLAEGANAARAGVVDARALALASGSAEGQKELKATAAARRAEAYAMRSVRWNESVAAIGATGTRLNWLSDNLRGVGLAARNAALFRVAEVGLLVGAASPSTLSTVKGSAEMLAAAMGKDLIPAVDAVSLALQQAARWWGNSAPAWLKGAGVYGTLGTLGVAGGIYGVSKLAQGAAAVYGGVQGAWRWAGLAMGGGGGTAADKLMAGWGVGQAEVSRGFFSVSRASLGAAAAVTAFGVAAFAAAEYIGRKSEEQGRQSWDRITHAEENLRRGQLERSEAFKQLQALPADQREEAAAELAKRYAGQEEAAKRAVAAASGGGQAAMFEKTIKDFGWLGEAASWTTGLGAIRAFTRGPGADYQNAQEAWEAARQRQAELAASRGELIGGKRFVEQPRSEGAKAAEAQQKMLRSLVGLPQSFMTDSAVEYANRISLSAQRPEGDLDKTNWANQLKLLAGMGVLLDKIERNTSPMVPRAANVNDRP